MLWYLLWHLCFFCDVKGVVLVSQAPDIGGLTFVLDRRNALEDKGRYFIRFYLDVTNGTDQPRSVRVAELKFQAPDQALQGLYVDSPATLADPKLDVRPHERARFPLYLVTDRPEVTVTFLGMQQGQ